MRKDKQQKTIDAMKGLIMDTGMWQTLRNLRKGYCPQPYSRKNKEGDHVSLQNIAEESAKHLASQQWKNGGEARNTGDADSPTRNGL